MPQVSILRPGKARTRLFRSRPPTHAGYPRSGF
jgi:hypothetical protein